MKPFAFVLLTAPLMLAADAAPDYFPLAVGNQWIYQASLGGPRIVEITGVESVNEQSYFVVTGLEGTQWLRRAEDGAIRVFDPESREERMWIDFAAPDQVDRESAAHPCSTTAAVASRRFSDKFHLGDFNEVTQVRFGGNVCADAGLTADYYLPNIGLLRRTEISLAGPRTYELTYARLNGVVMVTGPARSFELATDAIRYPLIQGRASVARIRMTLRLRDTLPDELTFTSSQEYDLILRNREGREVYRWSSTRAFLQVLKTVKVAGEKNWAEDLPLADSTGRPLPPGPYTLEAVITSSGGPQYRALVPLEIQPAVN